MPPTPICSSTGITWVSHFQAAPNLGGNTLTLGTFSHTRRKPSLTGSSEFDYIYKSSTTPTAWTTFTPPVPDSTDNGDPVETLTVTLPTIILAEPKVFLRIEAIGKNGSASKS